ncbi:MAG: hypothetical protein IJE90_04535 [Clostridia bacterium]|nr:hypothetical protein [Clostridia bacterium]
MKKYLSMILVVAIAAMLSISAFAAPTSASSTVPGNQNIDVTLGITGEIGHRYSVDIEYDGTLTFIYNASGVNWTVTEKEGYSYSYSQDTEGWTTDTKNVKIINHSDLELGYTVSMAKETKYDALNFTLNNGETAIDTLDACTVDTPYGTIKKTVTVAVTGDIPGSALDGDKLGVLTVAFNAVP